MPISSDPFLAPGPRASLRRQRVLSYSTEPVPQRREVVESTRRCIASQYTAMQLSSSSQAMTTFKSSALLIFYFFKPLSFPRFLRTAPPARKQCNAMQCTPLRWRVRSSIHVSQRRAMTDCRDGSRRLALQERAGPERGRGKGEGEGGWCDTSTYAQSRGWDGRVCEHPSYFYVCVCVCASEDGDN
jgi:hypothetical protein